jgi:hypothetical protein
MVASTEKGEQSCAIAGVVHRDDMSETKVPVRGLSPAISERGAVYRAGRRKARVPGVGSARAGTSSDSTFEMPGTKRRAFILILTTFKR